MWTYLAQYRLEHRCSLLWLVKIQWGSGNLVSTPIITNPEKRSSEDECYLSTKKTGIHLKKIESSCSIMSQFPYSHLSLTQHIILSFWPNNVLENIARLLKHSYLFWVGIHFSTTEYSFLMDRKGKIWLKYVLKEELFP